MADILRGLKAGLAVGLLMGFLNTFALLVSDFPDFPNWQHGLAFIIFLGVPLALVQTVIWLALGILFAILYDKILANSLYKSALFSIGLAVLLILSFWLQFPKFLYYIDNDVNVVSLVISFPLFFIHDFFAGVSTTVSSVGIIAYSFLGSFLLGYFWNKMEPKKAVSKKK